MESDPIGLDSGSLATYIYVDDLPLAGIDPFGLANGPAVAWQAGHGAKDGEFGEALGDALDAVDWFLTDVCKIPPNFAIGGLGLATKLNKANRVTRVIKLREAVGIGKFAGESIPARSPLRDFNRAERDAMNQIGKDTGCHTCGTKNPGTRSGDFVLDHQPSNSLNDGGPQRLYPHCLNCSKNQGLFIIRILRGQ